MKNCNKRHNSTDRFMEACLLMLLCEENCHGYNLAEQLSSFGFCEEQMNISTLYRTLRCMESKGFVISDWQKGDIGPKKRIYMITEKGKAELGSRIEVMRMRITNIKKLIKKYDEKFISEVK